MVAGLVEPDGGQIVLAGEDITRVAVHRRNLGLVFQSYALFPHMTVFENVAFGLRRRGVAPAELGPRVERMLELVRLGPLGARHPRELSGGQQQRVALARALVTEPRVSAPRRAALEPRCAPARRDARRAEAAAGTSRDHDDLRHPRSGGGAHPLRPRDRDGGGPGGADRPAGGGVSPARPRPFVARFLGRANFLAGTVAGIEANGTVVTLDGGELSIVAGQRPGLVAGQPVHVMIRQESIRLAPGDSRPAAPTASRPPSSSTRSRDKPTTTWCSSAMGASSRSPRPARRCRWPADRARASNGSPKT